MGINEYQNPGEVFTDAQGVCSQNIEQMSAQISLWSNDGTVERDNGPTVTQDNVSTVTSTASNVCGTSCASWNWWVGVFSESFTSANGWSGGTSGICLVSGNTMSCNGDTSTFDFTA